MDKVKSGQHAHGQQRAAVSLEKNGMMLIAKHLLSCRKKGLVDMNSSVPIEFTMNKHDMASVRCKLCDRFIGKCKVVVEHE